MAAPPPHLWLCTSSFRPSPSSRFPFSPLTSPSIAAIPSFKDPHNCCCRVADANNFSIDDVKSQLEVLHLEAEQTRSRANAARNRFMRLTETIENLRMRAGIELKAGKEENARQLIAEKQKIMQALEKSKRRAELLEELSNKLGEVPFHGEYNTRVVVTERITQLTLYHAISRKETHLIALLSSSNIGSDDSHEITSVRIVSPKMWDIVGDICLSSGNADLEETETQDIVNSAVSDTQFTESSFSSKSSRSETEESMFSASSDSYMNFLSMINADLYKIEARLHDFITVATMILPSGNVETTANDKVTTVSQIRHDVQSIRAKITNVVEKLEDVS